MSTREPPRPRLRTACTECHASKVKCSGERSGCTRCLSQGIECRYEISMVGRCTKRRKQRKFVTEAPDARPEQPIATPNTAGGHLHGRDDPSTMLPLAAETPILFNSWSPPPGCDLPILTTGDGVTADHNLSSHDLSFASGSGFEEFAAMISYSPRSQHALGTGCLMDLPQSTTNSSASASAVTMGNTTRLATLSQTCQVGYEELHMMLSRSANQTANNNNNNNAADVLRMCFASITALELQFEEEARPIDELMQAGKACARELRAAIELESFNQCSSCPMLIVTALDLLISLYEFIFNRLACGRANGAGGDHAPPAQSGNGKGASLRLGSFQADPEDAADVWIHLMLGELRRLSRLVDTVSSLRSDAATPEENAARAMAAPRGLCNNLHRRINTLVTSIQDRF
ncbi:hypothetical protein BDW72DRAFT_187509 [Aspergillus terricola var. indicus]